MNLQEQIDMLPEAGGTMRLPAGQHFHHGPLNLRDRKGVRIIGEGIGTELAFVVAEDQPLLIDTTGSSWCELADMRVTSRLETADVGMLLARNDGGDSAGQHRFHRLKWEASARITNVASFGSEINSYEHCSFENAAPGGANLITGRDVVLHITSPFGDVRGGSNLCHEFHNCTFGVYARKGRGNNIKIKAGTGYFRMQGGCVSNKTLDKTQPNTDGMGAIVLGTPDSDVPCTHIVLNGVEAETYGARNAIQIVGRVRGLRMQNCLLQSLESAIRLTGTLEDSIIEQNTLDAGMAQYDWSDGPVRALMVIDGGRVYDSRLDFRWRRLGPLARDQSPNDPGRRSDVALSVFGDPGRVELGRNEVIVQRDGDYIFFGAALRELKNHACRVERTT